MRNFLYLTLVFLGLVKMPSISESLVAEGFRLKTWRENRGLTQTQLGHACQAKKQQVWAWEKGREKIPQRVRHLLEAKLGVPLNYDKYRASGVWEAAWHPTFPGAGWALQIEREVLAQTEPGARWRFPARASFQHATTMKGGEANAAAAIRRSLSCSLRSPLPDLAIALQRAGIRLVHKPEDQLSKRLVAISKLRTVCLAGSFAPCESEDAVVERRAALLSVLMRLEIQSLSKIPTDQLAKTVERVVAKALLPDAALKDISPRSSPETLHTVASFFGAPPRLLVQRLAEKFPNLSTRQLRLGENARALRRESEILAYP